MKNKDGSFVVLFRDNKRKEVFLVLRSDVSIWNLPGGGIEEGETPEEAANRETFEETSFKIKLSNCLGTYTNIDIKTGGVWNKTYLFEGRAISGKFVPEFPGCEGQWYRIDNLPKNVNQITKIRIEDALSYKGKPFEKEFRPQQW